VRLVSQGVALPDHPLSESAQADLAEHTGLCQARLRGLAPIISAQTTRSRRPVTRHRQPVTYSVGGVGVHHLVTSHPWARPSPAAYLAVSSRAFTATSTPVSARETGQFLLALSANS